MNQIENVFIAVYVNEHEETIPAITQEIRKNEIRSFPLVATSLSFLKKMIISIPKSELKFIKIYKYSHRLEIKNVVIESDH